MKKILIWIFQFLLVSNTFSQINFYRFKHLAVQDGLSRNWVKCIFQDRIGYLWVGTADGLNRYDGTSFKTYKYKSDDPHSISHNNILVIYEDKKENIWVGTQAGLNLYDRKKDEFVRVSAINNYVGCICEYKNGYFLIGSPGGLFLFNPSDFTGKQIRFDINIEKILHDNNNNFWLASYKGLLLLDTADYSYTAIIPDKKFGMEANDLIRSLYQDSRGGIWVGTNSDGLRYMRYDKNNPTNPHFINFRSGPRNKESLSNGAVYAIAEDEKGYLWVGVENGGVNLLDLNTFSGTKASFRHLVYNQFDPKGLSDNSIHCIYRDKQNTIWIGTYGNGLNYYNALMQKFNHFTHLPGSNTTINNNRVNTIYEEENYLWIGTEEGLNVLDKHKHTFQYFTYDFTNPCSIGSNAVCAICRDSRNNLWIGSWSGGLNLFNESSKTFQRFTWSGNNPKSIGSNNIFDIIETRDKNLWIASMHGGLNWYDYKTHTFRRYQVDYHNKNSISDDWVMDLLESSDGNLWISTTVAVNLFDRKTNHFSTFTHNPLNPKSISYNGAISFFEDSKKNIWIGTSNGLNLYHRADSTFKHYYQGDGLPDNIIQAIAEDNRGNLWLSTNNGISEFVDAIHVPDKPVFKNYNINDGLQGNEFNARASFKNKEGLIYFGGNNGYNVFNPDNIKTNPYVPNLVFTRLLISNKPVKIGEANSPLVHHISMTKELKLSHKQNVFTIEFASLNLLAPENNQYVFMLEGFEKEWNYVGKQHAATYTNLNPGRYTFKVKASNNDGLWNEKGITLDIVMMPAWWQCRMAKTMYLLLFFLLIYFFRKHTIISVNLRNELWREHLEKKKSEELGQLKNQFFTNISHELRTPLTLILEPLKELMEPDKASPLQTIYRNASRLKTLVDQIMDISKIENHKMKLNLEHGDMVNHILGCSGNFIEFAWQKDISFHFKSAISCCYCNYDADKIEKILSNILSNAVKNTPKGGAVFVDLDYDRLSKILIIEITDTGRGIDPAEVEYIFDRFFSSSMPSSECTGTGIGLDLTKKLVELHKGTITVSSMPGKGATFTIKIPFSPGKVEFVPIDKILTKPDSTNKLLVSNKAVPPQLKHDKRILVIDDNAEMCDFIESILSVQYDVIKEVDSSKTLNLILNYMPDLIISDVMMPGINGFELVKQVRIDVRFSHIPIILLTAKVTVNDHITGYETGADDYIYKPFDGNILKARIKNLIVQKENLRKHFIGTDGIINSKIKANNLDVQFIDDILNQIKAHFSEPEFNVNDIIEKMCMSRSIFYKKYKALSDQPISDLIKNYRLKKATDLINSGQYPISQVAYICGFSDPAYFSKVFKEYYKMSPRDFSSKKQSQEPRAKNQD